MDGRANAPRGSGATIGRLLRVARRNLGLLVISALVLPVAAYVFSSRQEKEYTAVASLLFRDPEVDRVIFGETSIGTSQDPKRAAATNLKLARLQVVARRTAATVRGSRLSAADVSERVDVKPDGTSDLVKVEATDRDPRFAAKLATTFAMEFIRYRREADRAKVSEARRLVQSRLRSLPPEQANSSKARELERRAEQLDIISSLQTGSAELAQAAAIPSSPSAPKTKRDVALAAVLGILLGAALVLLREQLDRRLKDEDDVAEVFEGLPVLASVPESAALSRHRPDDARYRPESEAFLMLRANLRYFNIDRRISSILLTSAGARDGKTTVAWNLARAEAGAGESVLFVEADLRRPTLAGALGVQPSGGLSQVLAGMTDVGSVLERVDDVDVMFAGPIPPNPSGLIESRAMVELLRHAEDNYDRVIVDTPPVAVVADAIPLMTEVSSVVVVVGLRNTQRDDALQLRSQLAHVDAPVLGVVLNRVSAAKSDYYSAPLRGSPPEDEWALDDQAGRSTGSARLRVSARGRRRSAVEVEDR